MEAFEAQAEQVVQAIAGDYRLGRSIDRREQSHPDKAGIIALTEKLLELVFPSFSRQVSPADIREAVYYLYMHLAQSMTGSDQAKRVTLAFFSRVPAVRALAQTDLEAAFDGDPAATSHDEIIFCYPGLFATTVFRLAHELYLLDVPMIPRMMTEHAHSLTGIDIHPGAAIGSHFFIDHGTGIVIGQTTVIGKGVKIYQGVTLGGLSTRGGQSLKGTKRHPTIGDHVTIYAGASILGGETVIGENSVIGANAFITSSVPPCTTVTNQDQELRLTPRNCPGCEKREQ